MASIAPEASSFLVIVLCFIMLYIFKFFFVPRWDRSLVQRPLEAHEERFRQVVVVNRQFRCVFGCLRFLLIENLCCFLDLIYPHNVVGNEALESLTISFRCGFSLWFCSGIFVQRLWFFLYLSHLLSKFDKVSFWVVWLLFSSWTCFSDGDIWCDQLSIWLVLCGSNLFNDS